ARTRWTPQRSTARSCRRASGSSSASGPFDSRGEGATISRLPKLAALESPCKRPQRSASESNRNPFVPRFRGLGRESGPFLTSEGDGPVFENSTACVYVETSTAPRRARIWARRETEEG